MAVARACLLLSIAPVVLAAQQIPPIALKASNGSMRDTTASAYTVRELTDGRVLTPGGRHATLVFDFKTGISEKIPEVVGATYALGGDTTVVTSSGGGWAFLDGTRVLGMLPGTNVVVAAATRLFGFDADGSVLTMSGGQPESDSATVTLNNRSNGEKRLVTRAAQGLPAMGGVPAPAFVVNEMPVLAFDGWIAVMRVHPLRVDWRTPAGQWVLGKPFAIPDVVMDAREEAALRVRQGTAGNPNVHPPPSPPLVEPFTHDAPIATPDGKVLVKRTPTADAPMPRYDLVNRRGDLEGELTLNGVNDRIAGFGAKSVYLWIIEPQVSGRAPRFHLERYPWP